MGLISYLFDLFGKSQQKKNYVFQGGSVKGIAYIGALDVLEEKGVKLENIERIGGTSVGAITATLLSVGYDFKQLKKELYETDFQKFFGIKDENLKKLSLKYLLEYQKMLPVLEKKLYELMKRFLTLDTKNGNFTVSLNKWNLGQYYAFGDNEVKENAKDFIEIKNLLTYAYNNKGLAEGTEFLNWIEEKISSKTKIDHLTFRELYVLHRKDSKKYKQLSLIGTNASTQRSEIFSNEKTPDVIISDAVRISMSLPIVFKPHQLYKKEEGQRVLAKTSRFDFYVDGGVMDNYPIWLFDNDFRKRYSRETLGFCLKSLKEIIYEEANEAVRKQLDKEKIENMDMSNYNYLSSIVACYINKQASDFNLHEKEKKRTVSIGDLGISMVNFDLTNSKKDELIESGKDHTNIYIDSGRLELGGYENTNILFNGNVVYGLCVGFGFVFGLSCSILKNKIFGS